jgi:phospholipase/carboxylesterase
LAEEADWLAAELEVLAAKHGLDASKFIVIGYSNGANIALHMTLTGRCHFDKIIAYHAMSLTEIENPVSSASQIFLTFSGNDPIVSNENFAELLENLEATGVKPVVYQTSYGHQLTQNEIEASKNWLDEKM